MLDGRLDPLYYYSINKLDIVNNTIFPISKLSDVVIMQRGRFGHRPRNDPRFYNGDYPFIQTGDIVRACQLNDNITYTQTLNELGLKTSRLFTEPVVVLTIAANIGFTAILDYPACFPDSLIGMTPKTDDVTLEFINLYFKFIFDYLNNLAPQAAQKNINYQQLSAVPFIMLPLELQKKAVDIYKKAEKEKREKQQQAQSLLASIDDYLLKELGITLPEQDNSLEKRIFLVKANEISGNRWDVDYHKIFYSEAIKAISCNVLVAKIKEIILDIFQGVGKNEVSFSEYKLLKVKNIKSHNKIDFTDVEYVLDVPPNKILEHNDIISPFIGEAIRQYKFSNYPYRTKEKHTVDNNTGVIRIDQKKANPIYVCEVLNSIITKFQLDKLIGGGGVPFLGTNGAKEIIIPLPAPEKQQEIVNHIEQIRHQAKQLQQEAEQVLIEAKATVEKMILGEEI